MSKGDDKYRQARKKVEKQKRFYRHATTWILFSVFLMVLFLFLRMPPWITLIVIAGWGVSIAIEAVEVFGLPGMDQDWEERKIEEEIERMERRERHFGDESELDDGLELEDPPPPQMRESGRRPWKDSDLV